MRRLTPALLISLLCNAGAFAIENPVKSSAEIPRNALFDQLIGTWDVPYEYLDKKGNPKSNQGQVHYAWILVGKALQEIWSSNSDTKDLLPFGTMIDFYDLKHQRWTAVWIYPAEGMTMIMTGGKVNGSLVLSGHDQSGALQRWSTSGVGQRDSIVVRAEISNDDGKTWLPMEVSYLRRHQE